jgi:hypothetical protein
VLSPLDRDLSKLVVSGTALAAAAALVVVGLIIAVRPDAEKASQDVEAKAGEAAKLAAVAA